MTATPQQTIPVLDLEDFRSADPARQEHFVTGIGSALVEIGFFALVNHGIDRDVIDQAYATAEAFFELPVDEKAPYEKKELLGQRGYTSFGRETALGGDAPDLKEFWHVGREFAAGDPHADLYAPNLWPQRPEHFRPVFTALYEQLDRCATSLLEAASRFLGEAPRHLPDMAVGGDTVLRIIHYPPVPPERNPASVRAAAHEDINFLTLLCESTDAGLELLRRDGSWMPIHALKGQIIVDSGDMMQHLTNGLLRSCTHRVVNPDDSRSRRFSMPFFVHPRPDVDLTPLTRCVERTGGERRFPETTAGAFLKQRLESILAD